MVWVWRLYGWLCNRLIKRVLLWTILVFLYVIVSGGVLGLCLYLEAWVRLEMGLRLYVYDSVAGRLVIHVFDETITSPLHLSRERHSKTNFLLIVEIDVWYDDKQTFCVFYRLMRLVWGVDRILLWVDLSNPDVSVSWHWAIISLYVASFFDVWYRRDVRRFGDGLNRR